MDNPSVPFGVVPFYFRFFPMLGMDFFDFVRNITYRCPVDGYPGDSHMDIGDMAGLITEIEDLGAFWWRIRQW